MLDYIKKYLDIPDSEIEKIVDKLTIKEYEKDSILVRQGEFTKNCYFVIKGCLRLAFIDEDGEENTSEFYDEECSVSLVNNNFSLTCVEDSVLLVGSVDSDETMYNEFPILEKLTRTILEEQLNEKLFSNSYLKSLKPESRYKYLLETKPKLASRVPQHQLASYLGVTPETLSRIKKRLSSSL